MVVEQIVGGGNVLLVPAGPVARLVAGDQPDIHAPHTISLDLKGSTGVAASHHAERNQPAPCSNRLIMKAPAAIGGILLTFHPSRLSHTVS